MSNTSFAPKRQRIFRIIALTLVVSMLNEILLPSIGYALTGGPSQPEVQSFEPVGTSNMVDLSSGDFTYNIPLMEVDGYPINIAYHSGVTMDQEATWVGLGWNLNPGVINRGMRGLPDDFNGEPVEKNFKLKPNTTVTVNTSFGAEVFGLQFLTLEFSLGLKYNNYNGIGLIQGVNATIDSKEGASSSMTLGLGLSSSTDDGLTVSPSASFSTKAKMSDKKDAVIGGSVGCTFNSRAGLGNLTISASASMQDHQTTPKTNTDAQQNAPAAGDKKKKMFKPNGASKPQKIKDSVKSYAGRMGGRASASFDFGGSTYTPNIEMSMNHFSFTGRFTMGAEVFGIDGVLGLGGSFSQQYLSDNKQTRKSFGYLYTHNGQPLDALLDFNREKDGVFTKNTPALPVTSFTSDMFSVSGQGIGGSYRFYRGDIGYVFDPHSSTSSGGGSVGFELGVGNTAHTGADLAVNIVDGRSGKWTDDNRAASQLVFRKSTNDPLYENTYLKEANEKSVDSDPTFLERIGGYEPVRFTIDKSIKYNAKLNAELIDPNFVTTPLTGDNTRKKRDKRNQSLTYLTRDEYDDFALEKYTINPAAKSSHIAEISALGADGSRYVYGLPLYNTKQREVTFSVGSTEIDNPDQRMSGNDFKDGVVDYSPGENGMGNDNGIDNYYSSVETPAYAHSYLLTAIISPDYVDIDNVRGPSDGDFGSYTKFNYTKSAKAETSANSYKWRVPTLKNGEIQASFNEGLKSDYRDDKANYICGEKEIAYLEKIITKNHIAIFHRSRRQDGRGVVSDDGGINTSAASYMFKLDRISLYSKRDYYANGSNAVPIKEVYFEYDYTLCPGVSNNDGLNPPNAGGKLTLKKIFFSYGKSFKARLSPYIFTYSNNKAYGPRDYDRWGYYKQNSATTFGIYGANDVSAYYSAALPTSEFPYVEQGSQADADANAAAWCLTEIQIPSGGIIKVNYESDDYAYVQNKRAMQMMKIVFCEDNFGNNISDYSGSPLIFNGSGPGNVHNPKFYFKMDQNTTIQDYCNIDPGEFVYFRFLVDIRNTSPAGRPHPEFVSGYAKIEEVGSKELGQNNTYGFVKFKAVSLDDNGADIYNPVHKAAIQFGRLNMPRVVWGDDFGNENVADLALSIISEIWNSSIVKNMMNAILGVNKTLHLGVPDWPPVATSFIAGKSWIRLLNPHKKKFGGGVRVKKISMVDNWSAMVGNSSGSETSEYGQVYQYTMPDGTSSGVASYEPLLGNDENPFRRPIFSKEKHVLAPDDMSYMEEPFGETFFPSPSIVYSRVIVANLPREDAAHNQIVIRHGTGKTVHEFYTAKDFPTITKRTGIDPVPDRTSPFSLGNVLKFLRFKDYRTVTQGYYIELNDMSGKPRSQTVYQEGQPDPISKIEYIYKKTNHLANSFRLRNDCEVIYNDGSHGTADIGVNYDFVADFRESITDCYNASANVNLDAFYIIFGVLAVPMILPGYTNERTQFRSATTTKVIQRFGILDEIINTDLGSTVSVKNMAYDAETGEVLLTRTTNDFEDPVYTLKFPAYWYYDSMGPASRNVAMRAKDVVINHGVMFVPNAKKYFVPGDELALFKNIGNFKVWVTEVDANSIKVVKQDGSKPHDTYSLRIIRSGRRNNMQTEMAQIITRSNPLSSVKNNVYTDVIHATATEYSNKWKTYCNCFTEMLTNINYSSNPYVLGTTGDWKPWKEHTYLVPRTQSKYDANTNIRKDGVYTAFNPFYKNVNGNWAIDNSNWTYASEVTEWHPLGEQLENRDALGNYSAATFGYAQSLPISVAANSEHQQIGFDNFEDYDFSPCLDDHFKFPDSDHISNEAAHTGRKSIKVIDGTSISMERVLNCCEETSNCEIELQLNDETENEWLISSNNGTLPLTYSWEVLSGSPIVTLTSTGIKVVTSGNSDWKLRVTITDAEGCSQSQVYIIE